MAEKVTISRSCDWCAEHGTEQQATQEHPASADGTPADDVVDLCDGCGLLLHVVGPRRSYIRARLDSLDRMLSRGRPRKYKAAPPAIRTALALPEPTATGPHQPTLSESASGHDEPLQDETSKLRVECMECDPPKTLVYPGRRKHAVDIHNKQPWDIIWRAPEGTLPYPCTKHDECDDTGFALATERGQAQHRATYAAHQRTTASQPQKKKTGEKTRKHHTGGRWLDGVEQIGCPLPHTSAPGATKPWWIKYGGRSGHMEMSHKDKQGRPLKIWDVPWKLPDDGSLQLPFPCDKHDHCIRTGLAFKSAKGLETHTRALGPPATA